jgi:hypothetical protein
MELPFLRHFEHQSRSRDGVSSFSATHFSHLESSLSKIYAANQRLRCTSNHLKNGGRYSVEHEPQFLNQCRSPSSYHIHLVPGAFVSAAGWRSLGAAAWRLLLRSTLNSSPFLIRRILSCLSMLGLRGHLSHFRLFHVTLEVGIRRPFSSSVVIQIGELSSYVMVLCMRVFFFCAFWRLRDRDITSSPFKGRSRNRNSIFSATVPCIPRALHPYYSNLAHVSLWILSVISDSLNSHAVIKVIEVAEHFIKLRASMGFGLKTQFHLL